VFHHNPPSFLSLNSNRFFHILRSYAILTKTILVEHKIKIGIKTINE